MVSSLQHWHFGSETETGMRHLPTAAPRVRPWRRAVSPMAIQNTVLWANCSVELCKGYPAMRVVYMSGYAPPPAQGGTASGFQQSSDCGTPLQIKPSGHVSPLKQRNQQ